ncbi:MAG: hypothetical protein HRU09_19645 [Oligoflexales bacterium]|nr:hypothetical protein [Oligoflexales bacterium]
MKNSIFVIAPMLIAIVVYLFWPAEQAEKQEKPAAKLESSQKNKIGIVAPEKIESSTEVAKRESNSVQRSPKIAEQIPDKKSSLESVSNYVEMTGVGQEFYDLDAMLDAQIEQIVASSELSEEEKEQITKIFTDHIKGDDLLSAYKNELASQFSEEELKTLGKLNNDPIMKKIREDNPINDPRIGEQISEYFSDLEKNPVSAERQGLVEEVAAATKGADFIVDISQAMMENLGKHMGEKGDAPTPEEIEQFREQLKVEAEASVKSGILYQTRFLNDEELKVYRDNQTHPLAQRDQNIRKGVAKRTTAAMFSEIGKVGAQ